MLLIPNAIQKVISYRGEAPLFTTPPIGWILHVQVGNGSPFNYFQGLQRPNRKFSHLWVAKNGKIEQYQTLDRTSWAQGTGGNSTYWSVETEGFPGEPLTHLQIFSLGTIHRVTKSIDAIANRPGVRGIGTHSMGGVSWGNHSCPGAIRTRQRPAIIAEAQRQRRQTNIPPYPGITKLNDRGPVVSRIQTRLNVKGYHLIIDGVFGPITENNVKAFQRSRQLIADGIVGPKTWGVLWA